MSMWILNYVCTERKTMYRTTACLDSARKLRTSGARTHRSEPGCHIFSIYDPEKVEMTCVTEGGKPWGWAGGGGGKRARIRNRQFASVSGLQPWTRKSTPLIGDGHWWSHYRAANAVRNITVFPSGFSAFSSEFTGLSLNKVVQFT